MSNFFQELSAKFVSDGNTVTNFYLKHKKEHFVQNGIEIYGNKRRGYFWNYWQIGKIIKRTKPDVVISNFSYVNPALLFGKLFKIKTNIAWFHTVYGHSKPSQFKIWVKKIFLKKADIVIANSLVLQKELQTIYDIDKIKTRRIPFWTNISKIQSNKPLDGIIDNTDTLKVGCPGRLVNDKNHSIVIQALKELKDLGSPFHLYIAGDGNYKTDLERKVSEMKLENEVKFLGLLSAIEMASFYDQMDVVVLPSLHEAFGLVFIEALAMGTPSIVSNTFGALDFINTNKFAIKDITFDPKSTEGLKEKLMDYIDGNGMNQQFFLDIYNKTFEKTIIYNSIKNVINLKTESV